MSLTKKGMSAVKASYISYHLNTAIFFKRGGEVSHHLLGENLHRLVLQMMIPDEGFAG